MNSIRTAFLYKFYDFAPGMFTTNVVAAQQLGVNQIDEIQTFKEDYLSRVPRA